MKKKEEVTITFYAAECGDVSYTHLDVYKRQVVRSYERWREEHRSVKVGEHGITYMISTEYEKDGEMRRG